MAKFAAVRPLPLGYGHVGTVGPGIAERRMPTNEQLNEWMQAVASRADRPAFAALFRHFAPRLKGFLVRSGSDDALAEELVQETMVALWRRAVGFDPQRAMLSTWIYTIARNLRIDHHRRRSGIDAVLVDDWDAEQQPADSHLQPDELLQLLQRQRDVQRALAELPTQQAQLLRLSFFDEQPHSRIAQQLGIPLGTVKSRIRLAVQRLRKLMEQDST